MEYLINLILHLDKHLSVLIQNYGTLIYVILFLVIFTETGIVIMPFLPGDSLLFIIGALCSKGDLHLGLCLGLLFLAAVLGDTVNYWIGNYIGPKVFEWNSRFLKKSYLVKAKDFYEQHGGRTIIIARFIPIVRTFAPFVAGVGSMKYANFLFYNLLGGAVWVGGFILLGFFFGELPFVKQNFAFIALGIIGLSVVPPLYEYARHYFKKK